MSATLRRDEVPKALPGFDAINRYWDRRHNTFVAKILPGEFYVSRQQEFIATTLGSCVAACIWDEKFGIGGMNHFMLPLTTQSREQVTWGNLPSDANRYGNFAMEHLINEVIKYGGRRGNLRAKVFGGAKVLQQSNDVGARNADFVLQYLKTEQIPILAQDLGDFYPRKVMFDPLSGRARMKKLRSIHNNTILTREEDYRNNLVKKPVEGDIELF